MAKVTRSQERRFAAQVCEKCDCGKCDFSLEWRESCPKWRAFEMAMKKENEKLQENINGQL